MEHLLFVRHVHPFLGSTLSHYLRYIVSLSQVHYLRQSGLLSKQDI